MSFSQNNLPIEQELSVRNNHDIYGNPTDGIIEGVGVHIQYRSEMEISTPTGCTMIDIARGLRIRLNWIQNAKLPAGESTAKCKEYSTALHHINKVLAALRAREDRVAEERAGEVV